MRVACTDCGANFRASSEASLDKLQCSKCGGSLMPAKGQRQRRPSTRLLQQANAALGKSSLLKRMQCPNCWHQFEPEEILWVAESDLLQWDPVLGNNKALRFLPSRFNTAGMAVDLDGHPCQQLACPRCHLQIPRDLMSLPPSFLSIVGAPSCGKSYQLSAMSWRLRTILPSLFGVTFSDADPRSNQKLNQYEGVIFANPSDESPVSLQKTDLQGDEWYNTVSIGGQNVLLPQPFTFSLRPMELHPAFEQAREMSRGVVLYDNAGEHFDPSGSTTNPTATHHLAHSDAILFVFDPTRDQRFVAECDSQDPQLKGLGRVKGSVRQDLLVNEMSARIRNLLGLTPHDLHERPMIVVVAKCDIWQNLLSCSLDAPPYRRNPSTGLHELDTVEVDNVSLEVRALLRRFCPDFVGAVESFCRNVRYIPTSAHGGSPIWVENEQVLAVRPKDIRPIWAEVPFLYILSKWVTNLVGAIRHPVPEGALRPKEVKKRQRLFLVTPPDGEESFEVPADYAGQMIRLPGSDKEFYLDAVK